MVAISVTHLTKKYRGAMGPALSDVSLELVAGDVCGVIGPNGAGKTTLIGCLLGFLFPTAGTVRLDGRAPDDIEVRRQTGYLPERLVMDRWMSGIDFLRYHHALAELPAGSRRRDVDEAIQRVGLGGEAATRQVSSYSRGMLQRLGLAQALLARPRFLFLDEPTSGMDPSGVVLFRELIDEQRRRGTTVLLNSHQLDQVERVCTRIIFVKAGRIQSMGTTEAGAGQQRDLRVRLHADAGPDVVARALALTLPQGVQFELQNGLELDYAVPSDAGAVALLKLLIEAGVPVIEAVPGEGRLERLFTDPTTRPKRTL